MVLVHTILDFFTKRGCVSSRKANCISLEKQENEIDKTWLWKPMFYGCLLLPIQDI